MNCAEIRRLLVEDDPPQETIRKHVDHCDACARVVAADRRIAEATAHWRQTTSEAPSALRERVLNAMAREVSRERVPESRLDRDPDASGGHATRGRGPATPGRLLARLPHSFGWLAAAAALVVAILVGTTVSSSREPAVVSVAGGLVVDAALEEARRAERAHAEAIAVLAAAAEPILARGEDPSTPPGRATRLRAYEDRLASLDDAIAQVHQFLETNPGHAASRTMLLAAYIDKTELLHEILERETEDPESV